jgi:hypothetical protein
MSSTISVPYSNVRQENKFWCWAAVASNVYNSLFPQATKSQCQVAQAVGQNCNLPNSFSLADALNNLHIFEGKSAKAADFPSFILNELSGADDGSQEPVTAEVHFPKIVHFVAVTGLDPAGNNVWVADPFPGGPSVEFALNAFLNNYYFTDNHGQVQQCHGVVHALHAVNAGSISTSPVTLKFDLRPVPDDIRETVPDALLNFSSFNSASADLRRMLLESAQGKGKAWQVFTLGLPDLLEDGKGLDGVQLGGWRIAARSGDEVISADIYTGNTVRGVDSDIVKAGPPQLACIRRGEEILKMLNSIQQLSEPPFSDDIPAGPFDIHLLLLPGLVTEALWLKPQASSEKVSYVVPFNTLIKEFEAEKVCTNARFIEIVRPIAKQWKEYGEQEAYTRSEPEY